MRITVQGSTNKPREWLRLIIDPRSPRVFSWENVVYCDDTTCPHEGRVGGVVDPETCARIAGS